MKNETNRYKLLLSFLENPKNSNINYSKIDGKDNPDGFCIDVDSLNKEQVDFINNLPND